MTVTDWSSDHSAATQELIASYSFSKISTSTVAAVKARVILNMKGCGLLVARLLYSLRGEFGMHSAAHTDFLLVMSSEPVPKKPRGPYRQSIKPCRQTRYNRRKRAANATTIPDSDDAELPAQQSHAAEDISTADSAQYTCDDYELSEPIEGNAAIRSACSSWVSCHAGHRTHRGVYCGPGGRCRDAVH